MLDPKTFSFDVEKMTEFFKQNDFTKHLSGLKMPGIDTEALMQAQKKNMDALVEANKAAAAGYQDLFKKQMSIFEETMAEAQKQMKGFDATKLDADKAKAQGALAKAAFEKALANMQALAESAQKAELGRLRDRRRADQGEHRRAARHGHQGEDLSATSLAAPSADVRPGHSRRVLLLTTAQNSPNRNQFRSGASATAHGLIASGKPSIM